MPLQPIRDTDLIADLMATIRSQHPVFYEHLKALFEARREARRLQAESAADAHQAVRLLGRCTELSTIIQDLFPHKPEK